ncbi:hypothetical protein F2P56_025037 [Juglans regia]|uniref:X8 domain-containing protein n=2 Tax=Juglans regia TaxID=51240 RepID=A0A833TVB0_JUGRE|nr:hypothetical protein F2P56_025037 [Juglans regia]
MKMKAARGTFAIFLPLALAFLLSFAACTESRTSKVNGKRQQAAIFSRSHVNGKKLQHAKAGENKALYSDRARKDSSNTWCIAKPSIDNERLQHNVEYSCAQAHVNCSSIQAGGSCFHPNNVNSHASVVMNLFYQTAGKHHWNCHFNATGLIVFVNPSFGNCQYPA